MSNSIDIEPGTTFGMLTTLGPSRTAKSSGREWLCECCCGALVWRLGGYMRFRGNRGAMQSCKDCMDRGWGRTRQKNGGRARWVQRLEGSGYWARKRRRRKMDFRRRMDRLREDTTPSMLPGPEAILEADELDNIMCDAIDHMPLLFGWVLRKRFGLDGDEYTLDDVAKDLGRTRERARQLEEKALRLMFVRYGRRLRCFVPRAEEKHERKMNLVRADVIRRSAAHRCVA